jgi:hypothetical protein
METQLASTLTRDRADFRDNSWRLIVNSLA